MHNAPTCPYCSKAALLVDGCYIYPENPKMAGKNFWLCQPCDAWVACHENSPTLKPVGRLANAELRAEKRKTHDAFDFLWQAGYSRHLRTRDDRASKSECIKIAYRWLAEHMGLQDEQCHIGVFDVAECQKAQAVCRTNGHELMERYS